MFRLHQSDADHLSSSNPHLNHGALRANAHSARGALGGSAGMDSPAAQEVGPGRGEEQEHPTCAAAGWGSTGKIIWVSRHQMDIMGMEYGYIIIYNYIYIYTHKSFIDRISMC